MPRKPPHRSWRVRLTTKLLRFYARSLVALRLFPVTVIDRHYILQDGPIIVAGNHISLLDPPYFWGAARRVLVPMAAKGLWKNPLIGLVLNRLRGIPVARKDPASRLAAKTTTIDYLRAGVSILIFPEGYCVEDPEYLGGINWGVIDMALTTGVPIVAAGIQGANKVKPLHTKWYVLHLHRRVIVRFMPPINPTEYGDAGGRQRMMNAYALALSVASGKHVAISPPD